MKQQWLLEDYLDSILRPKLINYPNNQDILITIQRYEKFVNGTRYNTIFSELMVLLNLCCWTGIAFMVRPDHFDSVFMLFDEGLALISYLFLIILLVSNNIY